MENRIPDLSDWLQFLETKESLWAGTMLGIAAIFTSAIIGLPALYINSDIIIKISGLIGLIIFWITIVVILKKIGKETIKAQKLLDKIMTSKEGIEVEDIRKEWFEEGKIMKKNKMSSLKQFRHLLLLSILIEVLLLIGFFVLLPMYQFVYSISLQIIGVLLLSFWLLVKEINGVLKWIDNQAFVKLVVNLGFKDVDGAHSMNFDKFCKATGLGLVIAGLIVELVYGLSL